MKKVIKLTESDLTKIVKRVIREQEDGEKPKYRLSPEDEKEKKSVKLYYDKRKLEKLKKHILTVTELSMELIDDAIKDMEDVENYDDSGKPLDIDSLQKSLGVFFRKLFNATGGNNTLELPNTFEYMGQTFDGSVKK